MARSPSCRCHDGNSSHRCSLCCAFAFVSRRQVGSLPCMSLVHTWTQRVLVAVAAVQMQVQVQVQHLVAVLT